jgi:ABC-type branched-subunit amino acid transport system permease subunit/ABC-type branched-subunit amino acid transport system ATPase component
MTLGIVFSNEILFQGFIDGLVYALIALGIVLIYKSSGVINFAQGAMGAFGGFAMAILIVNYDMPYWLAAFVGIGASTAASAATELLVVRRLFKSPRLLLMVATLGVAQLLIVMQIWLPDVDERVDFPTPITSRWDIAFLDIQLRGEQLTVLIVVPALVILLAFLLQKTRFGLAVRSAADNPSAAQLAGVSIRAVSTLVWTIAGVLAGVSTLLIGPIQNLDAAGLGQFLGPELLLFALTAAMFGRLQSFPLALLGGVVLGVVNRLVLVNRDEGFLGSWGISSGSSVVAVFIILMLLMLYYGRHQLAGSEEAWTLTTRLRGASEDLKRHPLYRWLTIGGSAILALALIGLPWMVDKPSRLIDYSAVLITLMVVLSIVVLTGWAGQLSLGQVAFTAVGAYMTAYYANGLNYWVAMALGVSFGILAAFVVGIPALRLRGLYLGIATLGFALVVSRWVVQIDRLNGSTGFAKTTPPEIFGRWDLRTDKQAYYYLVLVAVGIVIYLLWRLRRSGVGRSMIAVRDNEETAAAYTISPTRAKLLAFAVSGAIAALAGALQVPATGNVRPIQYGAGESLFVISVAVVGGISSITGAVVGTILLVGLPTVFEGSGQVRLLSSGLGMLIVLMYFPGGIISLIHGARDLLLAWLAKRTGWEPPARGQTAAVSSLSTRDRAPDGEVEVAALATEDVSVHFGGRLAVAGVSIHVDQGEIVGLIGTNGAGKTTLMNSVSGFVPSNGQIELFGARIDDKPSYGRARLGVGRAFQNAKLFGSLTTRETIMTALEARERSHLVPSMLGVAPRAERRKRTQADEIINYLGLGRYADQLMSELSTGTRRIVELGALIALDTQLMLLDEPTAGVAQRETEAFGPLIHAIKDELGSSILLIEHDMPMVMSISDRIYCLESGGVIAEGSPDDVRHHPAVIASYLGTDERAIQRSGGPAD